MRVARVLTNETCNQACRFCDARRAHERRSIAAASAVRARIDAAIGEGASELVLTGGEPTLRGDLPAIVGYAKERGLTRIVLETNAARIDPDTARDLTRAGLHVARVHLPEVPGPRLDAISREAGGSARTIAGMAALAAEGIELEASAPIVRENLATIAELPTWLASHDVRRLVLRVPSRAPVLAALADLPQALAAIERVVDAAREVGIAVQLDAATWIPPCAFDRPARVAHLYTLGPGGAEREGHARPPACEGCVLSDRCPGLAHGTFSGLVPRPIRSERVRRRLSVVRSLSDQIERELVTREIYRREDGSTIPAHVVRIAFHCNQACAFCFVSTHLPPAPRARVEEAIVEIGSLGGVLVISGGEPTLDPQLLEYVRLGKRSGACEVELQTNATRLSDFARARELAEAGVDIAFVSLHGATADVSDAVTHAPGTFVQTLEGITNLLAASIAVRLNFVLCATNHHEFPAFVDLVAERFSGAAITVSFVGMSTDLVPRTRALVPRYSDVLPSLREGMRRATSQGIVVAGFDSMCGLPLCLVPDDRRAFFALAEVPAGYDRGEFVHPAPCDGCVLKPRCFGLRRGYASMYGHDELTPVRTTPEPSRIR